MDSSSGFDGARKTIPYAVVLQNSPQCARDEQVFFLSAAAPSIQYNSTTEEGKVRQMKSKCGGVARAS